MVLVKFNKEDFDKVLTILTTTGNKFRMFPDEIFGIDENELEILKKFKKNKIDYVRL